MQHPPESGSRACFHPRPVRSSGRERGRRAPGPAPSELTLLCSADHASPRAVRSVPGRSASVPGSSVPRTGREPATRPAPGDAGNPAPAVRTTCTSLLVCHWLRAAAVRRGCCVTALPTRLSAAVPARGLLATYRGHARTRPMGNSPGPPGAARLRVRSPDIFAVQCGTRDSRLSGWTQSFRGAQVPKSIRPKGRTITY